MTNAKKIAGCCIFEASRTNAAFRSFHTSATAQVGLAPFYNKHKKVVDPERLDPDFFEKEAAKMAFNERYLDNLKLLWEEKVGSQRDLLHKASDSLIGNKGKYGLPKVDVRLPRIEYRFVEALRTAPRSVRKIFSIEYGQITDRTKAMKSIMAKTVIGHDYDRTSHKSKIAWSTVCIRHWSKRIAYLESKFPRDGRPKWLCHRVYSMLLYRQAHLRWLSEHDSAEFDRVIKSLKIAYHVPHQINRENKVSELTRKLWSEKMLRARVQQEKETQLNSLHEKFMIGREERAQQINDQLKELEEEKKAIEERLKDIDIFEGKLSSTCVGKYQQKLIEEFTEISLHSILYYHPKPEVKIVPAEKS